MLRFVTFLVPEGINGQGNGKFRLLGLLLLSLHLSPEQLELQPLLDQRLPGVLHHLLVSLQLLCLSLIMAANFSAPKVNVSSSAAVVNALMALTWYCDCCYYCPAQLSATQDFSVSLHHVDSTSSSQTIEK